MNNAEIKAGELVEITEYGVKTLLEVTYVDDKEVEAYVLVSEDKSLEGASIHIVREHIGQSGVEIIDRF